jgi:hypothetical protein
MSRTTIAAMLAMFLALAPAASARPVDVVVTAKPKSIVLEQESTSGSGNQGGTRPTDAAARALAKEQAYSTYGAPTSSPKQSPVPVAADDDGEPWPLIGAGFLGIALLVGAAVALVAKPRRRVAA